MTWTPRHARRWGRPGGGTTWNVCPPGWAAERSPRSSARPLGVRVLSDNLSGSTILITGGTGTFGRTMTRRLLAGDCAQVRVLSRDEAKQDDMRRRFADPRLRFHLGNV